MPRKLIYIFVFCFLILAPLFLYGADLNHKYPKLANLFFRWDITDAEATELAKWDILIIDMDVQSYTPQSLAKIKQLNPNIKLLAYIASEEIRGDSGMLNGTLRQKLYNQIDQSWWLKNAAGGQIAWWQANPMINVTDTAPIANGKRWSDALPLFLRDNLMNTGYWDGILYDNVWEDVSFLSGFNVDLNQDGQAESMTEINAKWRDGMKELLQKTRTVLGPNYIVMGNGGDYYYEYVNGTLFEHFSAKGWAETMKRYRNIMNNGYKPAIGILNTNVGNTGKKDDYAKMRFGIASALLDNGYNSFDNGDQSHNEIWWYDEYEASLGEPMSEPKNILNDSTALQSGVWRREFKNGLVLVNSTSKRYDVDLGGEFEKLHGTQDTLVNDGSFVSRISLASNDGLVLLRPIEKIYNATYVNGSFARVYNRYGHVARSGFFVYDDRFKGGNQVIAEDINNDGLAEAVVANNNQVSIYNNAGRLMTSFYPYTEKYNQGINITVGDLDRNGTKEIITGTERGGGPQVRIFNNTGKLINPGFFAYAANFRGGVNVTVGDLDGNGTQEIIAGAGVGGGPHVRVFSADGKLINPGFFAYDKNFRGGVNVAAGDIDADGKDEIITGPGKGGGPQVKVFNQKGQSDGPTFFAFDQSLRAGVEVAASDMDGDGKAEIIATTADVFTLAGFED